MRMRTPFAAVAASLLLAATGASAANAAPAGDTPGQGKQTVSQSKDNRIVGGRPASGSYPGMVGLSIVHDNGDRFTCGGTQISRDLVLTAEHCLEPTETSTPERVDVRIGSNSYSYGGVVRTATKWRTGGGIRSGDWAVLKLDRSYDSGSYATLASDRGFDNGPTFRAVGWGATSEGGRTTDRLREVDVPFVPDSDYRCNGGSAEICAGDLSRGGIDTCQGDSGGPLMADAGGDWVQVGIVSWGDGCARPGQPGHYTQVSTYYNAIMRAGRALGGQLPG